jgi:hypothetical protein
VPAFNDQLTRREVVELARRLEETRRVAISLGERDIEARLTACAKVVMVVWGIGEDEIVDDCPDSRS